MTGSDVSAVIGSPANLTCSVSSNPNGTTVTYQWKRDGMSTISQANSSGYQVSSSVTLFDADVYTCEATVTDSDNSPHVISGTGSVKVTLIVTCK